MIGCIRRLALHHEADAREQIPALYPEAHARSLTNSTSTFNKDFHVFPILTKYILKINVFDYGLMKLQRYIHKYLYNLICTVKYCQMSW